jgi:peptidoglycan/xylan/chitin deacetylase (PgdA/CDA1 family)
MLVGPFLYAAPPVQVTEYRVALADCRVRRGGESLVALRAFRRGGQKMVLAVDADSLKTRIVPEAEVRLKRLSPAKFSDRVKATAYGRAMVDSERHAAPQQDAGITHALPSRLGVVLTVDLCPSTRPLDRELFTSVISTFAPEEMPVPLGIAITGKWMQEHPTDLKWLREREEDGQLAVTWINHSFNHRYSKELPLSHNFLLEPGTDADAEILETEVAMIAAGLCPSVFFRFPGLVSEPSLVRRVVDYGLAVVGSDAWLAKGQATAPGSIVLVHGNGNEPIGIERFLELMKSEGRAIRDKHWLLFDLRDAVAREEGPR